MLPAEFATVTRDSAWTIHQCPRAIRVGDKTFVGSISSNGVIQVTSYNHSVDTFQHTQLATIYIHDHSSPSIYARDDDCLVVFWTTRRDSKDHIMS